MSLEDMQKDVDAWAQQFKPAYWDVFHQHARLSEEIGEVARELNHLFGSKKKKAGETENTLGKELADVIFTIVCMANSNNINLEQEWKQMMEKKHWGRDNNRFERKNS